MMQDAPHGALFVWCNDNLMYPRNLARSIGRTDLRIEGPSWLDSDRWRGLQFSGVVLDHAAPLTTDRQLDALDYLTARIPGIAR